ncbi:MAG: ribbon-helix-helix protein, CopG family [Verrucomicrobiota bacterium]
MKSNALSLELDAATARLVEHLAEVWGVTREEAVRRAVIQADAGSAVPGKGNRLEALKELQRRLALTPAKAAKWQAAIHEARR